jgi:uroporphyrin-III C-methyltransferase
VTLVGAGPGDPDLLTHGAARALGEADLVLYHALVDARVLALATRAHRFYVGKRAGKHALSQASINALMVRAAKSGRDVVRLKAGDPFVLGRGGEEVLALDEAGIDVRVISGVSSAIAGPAFAGIPVTHRDVSPGVLVVSAVPADHYQTALAALPPRAVTVVLMMAIGARAEIAAFLRGVGWPDDHPAAIVLGAHTARAWSWVGTLGALGALAIPDDVADVPGLIVLGAVVDLARTIGPALQSRESIERGIAAEPFTATFA